MIIFAPKKLTCLLFSAREQLKELTKQYDKSENDLKALQSVGQVCVDIIVKCCSLAILRF